MPAHKAETVAQQYDQSFIYAHMKQFPADAPRPLPTCYWPRESLSLLERYHDWLVAGGVSEKVTNLYHVMMAGHVFGLTLKQPAQLDPDRDLDCALEYVKAKNMSASWIKNCHNSLVKFRRFLRLERGLGEETRLKTFNVGAHTQGLPLWLVSELERYQHILQRNWRTARVDLNLRGFWSKYGIIWRYLCQERGVQQLADLKRQHILDLIDKSLDAGYSVATVNDYVRLLHSFLLFLGEEGYNIPQSVLRIPGLKQPDPLPRYLSDEQVKKLRNELERMLQEARISSHRRLALLMRAVFYLLWQGGLRLGEVEELRLEDLDFPGKRFSVRNGKGLKDRTIYLTETALAAVREYLQVRGEGGGDHVFLYRHSPLKKDLIRAQLQYAGDRIGVKVYPHRLRHTCATQLLNAGCRVTSIQAFLGHKKLNTTMIYARAYDQTVADDYFAAMQRVEQRLEIVPIQAAQPEPNQNLETGYEIVKDQERARLLAWVDLLSLPELPQAERLSIADQMKKELVGSISPPVQLPVRAAMQVFEDASP